MRATIVLEGRTARDVLERLKERICCDEEICRMNLEDYARAICEMAPRETIDGNSDDFTNALRELLRCGRISLLE